MQDSTIASCNAFLVTFPSSRSPRVLRRPPSRFPRDRTRHPRSSASARPSHWRSTRPRQTTNRS